MSGPSRDGANEPGPLDDATVAERWAELTAGLGDLQVPDDLATDGRISSRDRAARDRSARDRSARGRAGTERSEPDDGARDDGATSADDHGVARRARPLGPRDYVEVEDPDENTYVPPEPEALGHSDPVLTLAWVATIGSLLVGLVIFVVASPSVWVMLALGVSLLGGVGLLLWRMPARRDGDDHGDGAIV